MENGSSLFGKYEFLIRRLHSLSGLIPVGAYMVVHLTTNASIMNGPKAFQNLVYQIHSLGNILPVIEWAFIFLPILFHAVLGVVIIFGGKTNTSNYSYTANWRYTLQRITGMLAFFFIAYHVLHMHGIIHAEAWIQFVETMGMAQFAPYNAASTVAESFQGNMLVPLLYFVGIVSCVFHFANGLWTMGITWGVWTSPAAQQRALYACGGVGVIVFGIAMSAMAGFLTTDLEAATEAEAKMYVERVRDGSILENDKKLSEGGREWVDFVKRENE